MEVSNAAYNMDWTLLRISTQKNILMLMIGTHKPIRFTSGNIIILTVQTYNSVSVFIVSNPIKFFRFPSPKLK